ncbi:MAG TPA: hypothetical protein DEF36_18680 [Desulfotomaculum sp.]|nr:hypothetical protein [Desulfotomaculum sp.]
MVLTSGAKGISIKYEISFITKWGRQKYFCQKKQK